MSIGLAIVLVLGAGGAALVNLRPDLGNAGADTLRDLFGDRFVAQLETTVFQTQDRANALAYQVGAARPSAPWEVSGSSPAMPAAPAAAPIPMLESDAKDPHANAPLDPFPAPTFPPAPAIPTPAQPAAPAWALPGLPALGTLAGAGQWSEYLRDSAGRVVAYRAFLQPDPARPYAVAAIVAFDLQAARLHFVLGTQEPSSPVLVARSGAIPAPDKRPGVLLAAFNGGFKARHGHFGAMSAGTVVLPPIDRFGTVAMYRDGSVRIGAWGTEVKPDPSLLAWRQNGPLVIEHGQVNPHTADITSRDWGIILNGVTAVWRSGLAISADRRTLYYVAGNSLTLPALVRTLAATGADAAIQLDINIGMVHFDAMRAAGSTIVPAPLFAAMKPQQDDRFLTSDTRDYFYVTAAGA
jgi:hypothetical protein